MQLVDPPHQHKVCSGHRARQVVDAATTDVQRLGLLGDRQIVLTVGIALRSVNLLCRALLPKNRSPASALRSWRATTLHRRPAAPCVAAAWTNIGSPALKLRLPRRDLIGVDVELFRKLGQRSIALDGGKRHLRFKSPVCGSGAVVGS